jgi:hypothetical protein
LNWLIAKLSPLLIEACLDWLIEQLSDNIRRRRIIARHGKKIESAFARLKAAETDEQFREAANEVIKSSWN